MAAESLIVTISDGTTDNTYNKVSQSGFASRFALSGNTQNVRLFFDIDHKVAPAGSLASDVHTLTHRREEVDTDTNRVNVCKVSLQITQPKGDAVSNADIYDDVTRVMCLFKKAFIDGFIAGETPTSDYSVTGPFNPARA